MKEQDDPEVTTEALRARSMGNSQTPCWRTLEQAPGLAIHELLCAPLGSATLVAVIHLRGNCVILAQPLWRDWGTSITTGAEAMVRAAHAKFGEGRYYEWYFDQDSFDEIRFDPASGRISWRYFSRPRFEAAHSLTLPEPLDIPSVRKAEGDYLARYAKCPNTNSNEQTKES